MIGLGKEAPFRMGPFEPQSRHHVFVRQAFESVHQRTRLGDPAAEFPERPSFDNREGVLNDGPRNQQVEETDRGKAWLQGILSGLDAAGVATPARLQLQAQCRFDEAFGLEVPGYAGDGRAPRHVVYERLAGDPQRTFHRTSLGLNEPETDGRTCQEERQTREYDSPQELQPSETIPALPARRPPPASEMSGQLERLKMSVPFVPPNPNEFDIATSIFVLRAAWGT